MTQPSAQTKPATHAAKAYAQQLLRIMAELSTIMEEETPLIEAYDYNKNSDFLLRKQELTVDYQAIMKVMAENQELLKSLSPQDISELRTTGKRLDAITQKNARALRAAHHATDHLMNVVINEIRKDLHKTSGYSPRGVMALAEASYSRPISINQRI